MTTQISAVDSTSDTVDLSLLTIAELVHKHYEIDVEEVTPLGAESSAVCRVRGTDGSVIAVKIFWDDASSVAVHWQHEVVSRLAEADHPVARPLRAADGVLTAQGEVGGRRILLQASEWLSGLPLEQARISPSLLREIGRTAARLHRDLANETAPRGLPLHTWEIARSRQTIEAAVDRIRSRRHDSPSNDDVDTTSVDHLLAVAAHVCRVLRESVEPRLATLPRAVVHHDLHDSNLLVGQTPNPTSVVGILDFGDMLESVRISEPLIAAAYAARNTSDPLAAVNEVMAGWAESVPITDDEAAVVVPLASARLMANAAVWTSRLGFSRDSYATARLHGSLETAELLIGKTLI